MVTKGNNFAYIDGANLYTTINNQRWSLDYRRFRIWLTEKYGVEKAFIFLGYLSANEHIYRYLRGCGFVCHFREVSYDGNGKVKGNCDADLILRVAIDTFERNFDKCVIVTSDGDYVGLVKFLIMKEKLEVIISPAPHYNCSVLLRRSGARIIYIDDKRGLLSK